MIITKTETDAVIKRVAAGEEPFASVYARLTAAADEALTQQPVSIMDSTHSHIFKENASYVAGKDGVAAPQPEFSARKAAGIVCQKSLLLGAAWRLTGNAAYADKALELINAWCINQDTYMAPIGHIYEPADQSVKPNGDITLFAFFNNLFLAAHHLTGYDGWGERIREALKRWVRSMVDANRYPIFFKGYQMYNNWEDARLLYLCKGALFLQDNELLQYVFDRWKEIIPEKMTAEGILPREAERTRSLHYHLFALNSTIQVAAIADNFGENLFGYEKDGKSLKLAIDYVARHLLNPESWPHPMLEPYDPDADRQRLGETFDMAYTRWGDELYLDIINKYDARKYDGNYVTLLTA